MAKSQGAASSGMGKGFGWNMEISFIICANVAIVFLADTLYTDAIWWPEWDIKVLAIAISTISAPNDFIKSADAELIRFDSI